MKRVADDLDQACHNGDERAPSVTEEEIKHVHLLLKLCLLSRKVREKETAMVSTYRKTVVVQACAAWRAMPKGWLSWTPDRKGQALVDYLHEPCCQAGKAGMNSKCTVSLSFEEDVVMCINSMIKNKKHREQMFDMCAVFSAETSELPCPHDFAASKKRLREMKESLINNYFAKAAWKKELDQPLTPLESLLTDPASMACMGFFDSPQTSAVVRSVCGAMLCKFNRTMCRGCRKPIHPGNPSAKKRGRKAKGRRRKPAPNQARPCPDCRSVYFCSDECAIAGAMGRHKSIECQMLKDYKAYIKPSNLVCAPTSHVLDRGQDQDRGQAVKTE